MATAGEKPGEYPAQPIKLLVGYARGSVGDQIARGMAFAAKEHLSQPLIVVNRPGASGTIAISEALRAVGDGHTLGLGTIGTLTVQPHCRQLSYGSPDTYACIANLVTQPNVLVVRAGAPWKTAEELIRDARAHPGKITAGVPGVRLSPI